MIRDYDPTRVVAKNAVAADLYRWMGFADYHIELVKRL
jgi:hypothetical protein